MSMGAFLVMFADAALAEAVDKAAGLSVDMKKHLVGLKMEKMAGS